MGQLYPIPRRGKPIQGVARQNRYFGQFLSKPSPLNLKMPKTNHKKYSLEELVSLNQQDKHFSCNTKRFFCDNTHIVGGKLVFPAQ